MFYAAEAQLGDFRVLLIHRQAVRGKGVSRTDAAGPVRESGLMKKRLLITGLILAALLLALYGVMFGPGAK
jgi:hypothetical protein